MTTERELAEWPEKIRRVRGQTPLRKSSYQSRSRRKNAIWLRVILFISGLAIALAISNQLKQSETNSPQPQIFQENRR